MAAMTAFCTHQIPLDVLNRAFSAPSIGPQYSLVQNSTQTWTDPNGTPLPITTSFETDFTGWTIEDLTNLHHAIVSNTPGFNSGFDGFAVLDERTVQDDTITLWFNVCKLDTLDVNSQEFDEVEAHDDQIGTITRIWLSFRVRFQDAQDVTVAMGYAPDCIRIYCLPYLVGADGVLDAERAGRIIKNEEPNPLQVNDDDDEDGDNGVDNDDDNDEQSLRS